MRFSLLILFALVIYVYAARANSGAKSYTKYINSSNLFINETFQMRYKCRRFDGREEYLRKTLMKLPYFINFSKYDVEHIIDKNNSIWPRCDKDIYGNIILANSSWNRAMGQRTWHLVEDEKKYVYGAIFNKAKDNVLYCCRRDNIIWYVILFIYIIMIMLALGIIIAKCVAESKTQPDIGTNYYLYE